MEVVPNLVVSDLLARCRSLGLPVSELVEGLGYDKRQLSNPFARGDWTRFTVLLDRIAAAAGDEGLERLGERVLRRHAPANAIARLLVDPEDLYRFINNVFAPWLFPHVRAQQTFQGAGRLCLTLEIPRGFRASRPWLRICAAAQRTLPSWIGRSPAKVEAEISDRRGQFWIGLPASAGRKLSSAALSAAHLLMRVGEIFRDRPALDFQAIGAPQSKASVVVRARTLARGWKLDAAQVEAVRLVAVGHSDAELAQRLGIPSRQVEALVARTMVQCEVTTRKALIALFWSGL